MKIVIVDYANAKLNKTAMKNLAQDLRVLAIQYGLTIWAPKKIKKKGSK